MATRAIGTDRRSLTKVVALMLMLGIGASVLALQARSLLWAASTTAVLPPPVIVLNELPTGPQHGQGPHPHEIDPVTRPGAGG